MKKFLLLFLLIPLQSWCQKKLNAEEITSSVLKTTDGKLFRVYEARKFTAAAFVFLLPDCPACENYTSTLNKLSLSYTSKGIMLYGVFPSFVKASAIENFRKQYRVSFPLLMDFNKELVKAFDAKVAPSVFVISESAEVLYRGRIDDWMYAVGKKRTVITHHELEDALSSIASNKKIIVNQTQPVGCLID